MATPGSLLPGQLVEVCGDSEEGFVGSWCPAAVVDPSHSKDAMVVQYLEFVNEHDGQPLREPVSRKRVRPAPPTEIARFKSMKDVKLGDSVEVYQEDCWWQGAVVALATAGVQVNMFESDGTVVFIRDPALLRPRCELADGVWRVVVPPRKELLDLGLEEEDVKAAIKAMKAAPPVPQGAPRMRTSSGGGAAAAAGSAAGAATAPPPAAAAPPPLPAQTGHVERARSSPWARRPAAAAGGGADSGPAAAKSTAAADGGAAVEQLQPARLDAVFEKRTEAAAAAGDGGTVAGAAAGAGGTKRKRDAVEGSVDSEEDEEDSDDGGGDEEGEGGEHTVEDRGTGGAGPGPSSRAAAAAAAAAARPRREGKNRVIYVNGFPVLKSNMYGLHDEDTMVWQRGLQTGDADLAGVRLQPPAPRASPAAPRPKQPKPAKPHAPEFLARQEHNNAIRRDMQAGEATRARYLLQHMDRISPFITPQVEARIRAAAAPTPASKPPAPVTLQPEEILATLREYQLEGLSWMAAQFDRGVNAILADEMGLGKTLQTITFLAHLKFVRHVEGPHLVVVPLSVLPSWMSEFKRWCPKLRVVRLHSTDTEERKRLVKEVLGNPSSFDVAVTTYEMINSQHFGHSLKHTLVWRYLVLDEGHKVKNEETRVSDGMRHISRQQVLMLTGTPIQNNLHELFALLSFMYPDVFTDPTRFDAAFNLAKGKVDRPQLEAAHYLLRPFLLRRLKEEVEVSLPPRLETRVGCPLAAMQTFWYRRLLMRDCQLLGQAEGEEGGSAAASGSQSWKKAMNLLMQLRKVCNHPFMFPDAEPDFDGETAPEELVTGSGKMMVLDRMLAKLKERGHRVVLFSQFNIMLNIIEDFLVERGYNYRRLDGSTNRIKRMIDMEQFNKPGSDIFIYILCTRAGGLGVNLQTADTCILFDSDWNPQWDLQAMARVHRIGQTRPVHVYRLVSEGTVEDRIQRRAEAKLYLDQMVNRGSTSGAEALEGLALGEVLAMLRFGADRIFRTEAGQLPSEQQLDALMDRSRMMVEAAAKPPSGCGAAAAGMSPPEGAQADGSSPSGAKAEHEPAVAPGPASPSAVVSPEVGAAVKMEVDVDAKQEDAAADGDVAVVVAAAADAGTSGGGGGGGSSPLVAAKHTALEFNAEAPAVDTFMFQGQDFRSVRAAAAASNRDIAAQYWEQARAKRQRKERLVNVDGFDVLRDNCYTMEEGMLHHPGQVRGQEAAAAWRRKTQRAGIDYDHTDFCLICWDGGDLLCCDHCPAAFHPECVGLTAQEANKLKRYACPHHACAKCERNTGRAGGLLFRCEMCGNAFCEDDLPAGYHMVGECDLFKALGQRPPNQACFIHCSDRCRELSMELRPLIDRAIERAVQNGPPGEQQQPAQSQQPAQPTQAQQPTQASKKAKPQPKQRIKHQAQPGGPAKAAAGKAAAGIGGKTGTDGAGGARGAGSGRQPAAAAAAAKPAAKKAKTTGGRR